MLLSEYEVIDAENNLEIPIADTIPKSLICYSDGGYTPMKHAGHYCFMIGTRNIGNQTSVFHRYYSKFSESDFSNLLKADSLFFTHNAMEYVAVLKLVEKLPKNADAVIHLDSMLVVKQLNKEWRINYDHLESIAREIWSSLHAKSIRAKFLWLPREQNLAGHYLEKIKI